MKTIPNFSHKNLTKKRRIVLFVFIVLILVLVIVLLQVFISILLVGTEVVITSSNLQNINKNSTDYKKISVDVYLHNSGGPQRATVWVEITHQTSNVSFSKSKSIQIGYKQPIKLTIEFTLDKLNYSGEFDHHVWLTYPNSQD